MMNIVVGALIGYALGIAFMLAFQYMQEHEDGIAQAAVFFTSLVLSAAITAVLVILCKAVKL